MDSKRILLLCLNAKKGTRNTTTSREPTHPEENIMYCCHITTYSRGPIHGQNGGGKKNKIQEIDCDTPRLYFVYI